MAAGMFGILGNAFAKGTVRRRAELPDIVQTPEAGIHARDASACRSE